MLTLRDLIERGCLVFTILLTIGLCLPATGVEAQEKKNWILPDARDVWSPRRDSPKLITPQWIGEADVECVVTLAIDDMREPAKYEAYLRPILQRLKQIDGRAPVSIMTCAVKPDDPQLQSWLAEGLSLECHTFDHPCPILANGDLQKSKGTYDRCVDLLSSIPNNHPVAFRTPCCDSLNTVSPRLFSTIINQTTGQKKFLQLDSSVFTVYTADDPEIPRSSLADPDGREKFRKYIPRKLARGNVVHDGFVNTIENYPYPFVIQNQCWEFPCMVPSDWSANHLHKPNNPDTVRDLKIALDITVQKRGVYNLVFHPHGWIKAEQVVELIDHAVATHGRKVKFLTFRECVQRLSQNLLKNESLRGADGSDQCIRVVDVNQDGFVDVLRADGHHGWSRLWEPAESRWIEHEFACRHADDRPSIPSSRWQQGRFSIPANSGKGRYEVFGVDGIETWEWQGNGWSHSFLKFDSGSADTAVPTDLDIDGDGRMDRLMVLFREKDGDLRLHAKCWMTQENGTNQVSLGLPIPSIDSFQFDQPMPWSEIEAKQGARWVDLDQDGRMDLIVSNSREFGAWLMTDGGSKFTELLHVERKSGQSPEINLPPIVHDDGSENGFFVRDRHLCWINEGTDQLPDFIMRVAFDSLVGERLPQGLSTAAAQQSMRVTPGYRVDLVAHEPLTMDPVAMDWGPDGKLWVAEMADYPRGIDDKGKPGGRIRYLQDTDGDGIYDKSTLFLEDVRFPNGVLSWKKGVLVSAAPDVFYAEDTDGDGKADLQKVLFTGFAEGNQQHRVNGFSRGLDHWLYLANGDSGGTIRAVGALTRPFVVEEAVVVDIRGRDIRIRPDTGEIEAIAGQAQFGRNRDDWGNWFGNNNSRPIWHYVLDDHYLRRNPFLVAPGLQKEISVTPGAAPVFPASRTLTRFNDFHALNRFTSACSSMVYRDTLIGDGTAQVFISEPVHNLVHREILRPDELSFTSQRSPQEEQSEFLASTDNWFRPTQIKTGPDGALYVADMYRLVIEHPQWIPIEWQRRLDLRAGHDKGRLWRVAPVGARLRTIPRLDAMTSDQLVAALSHSNGWQRDLAQQLLLDRADAAAIPLLSELGRSPGDPANTAQALGRLHALCTLDGLFDVERLRPTVQKTLIQLLPILLADPHAGVRRHAIRVCERFPEPGAEIWQKLNESLADPDPQVRLQLAYSLGEFKHPQAGVLLGRLAVAGLMPETTKERRPLNPQFSAAVISSLNSTNLESVLAEAMQHGSGQTDLLQQLLAQATSFNHLPSLVALLNRATEPTKQGRYERWQYAAIEQFLVSLDRRFATPDKWLESLSPEHRPVASRLQALLTVARTLAANDEATLDDRVAAVRVLGRLSDSRSDLELLQELITPRSPSDLQSAALTTLSRMRSNDVAPALIAGFKSLAPSQRAQASAILLSRDAWCNQFMDAIVADKIAPADLDAATRQRLLDHRTKSVAQRAAKILAVGLNSDRARLVAEYLPVVRAGGDAQLGSQLFKTRCSQCHKLGDVGHAVGPDLLSLTDKSADALLTAVLDPNRAVETKFLAFIVVTKAGGVQTGLMASETAGSITLRAAEGKETTLLRSEIEEIQSMSKSLMPEGLERELKPADLAALVSYIRRNVPLPAAKKFPGNEPRIVKPDASGKFTLNPDSAEIYGPTIVIEEKHQNLGWWSSADDVVIWTVEVPQPGKYKFGWKYACEPNAAGSRLIVEAAGKSLTHRVEKTDNWDTYVDQQIGELELPAGQVRITLKPASRPLPALADVKSVTLSPE